MSNTIIKIDHVSKEYRLGAIGGGTLRGDLQSWAARVRGKTDPNAKLGQDAYSKNERFLALDDVSFSIERGERVGIIGHNGAGKSTLLKLLSRVTAPTKGLICYNGRISSMLEVGTGFHPELTGRENVYLNGAILGMTKKEIDAKFDEIVSFAEMEKFIDTPVKRYSSGMYVKLAFAVAAHLDSEILVMDEVLAVGDMKFQEKCLGKMGEVSANEGRTVLYVSHNMNTIRQLCNRCIVLDHGKIVFDGEVEAAIQLYLDNYAEIRTEIDSENDPRPEYLGMNLKGKVVRIFLKSPSSGIVRNKDPMDVTISYKMNQPIENLKVRIEFLAMGLGAATAFVSKEIPNSIGQTHTVCCRLDVSSLCGEIYKTRIVLYREDSGNSYDLDLVNGIVFQKVIDDESFITWNTKSWGFVRLPDFEIVS